MLPSFSTIRVKAQYPGPTLFTRKVECLENQALTITGMDYKKEIGRRIREAREEKGWTLEDLSRKTGDVLSLSRVSNYENGFRMPGPQESVILGKALHKRASWIMAVDEAQLPISLQEEALIRNWRTLSERERMEFFRKLETMALSSRDPTTDARVLQAYSKPPQIAAQRRTKASKT